MDSKMNTIVDVVEVMFWDKISSQYPEAKTDDVSPLIKRKLKKVMEEAVDEWVKNNIQTVKESAEEAIRSVANKDDYFAAQNYHYLTTKIRGWNAEAQEQFLADYCVFSKYIEALKDDFDLTYAEIVEILIGKKL